MWTITTNAPQWVQFQDYKIDTRMNSWIYTAPDEAAVRRFAAEEFKDDPNSQQLIDYAAYRWFNIQTHDTLLDYITTLPGCRLWPNSTDRNVDFTMDYQGKQLKVDLKLTPLLAEYRKMAAKWITVPDDAALVKRYYEKAGIKSKRQTAEHRLYVVCYNYTCPDDSYKVKGYGEDIVRAVDAWFTNPVFYPVKVGKKTYYAGLIRVQHGLDA